MGDSKKENMHEHLSTHKEQEQKDVIYIENIPWSSWLFLFFLPFPILYLPARIFFLSRAPSWFIMFPCYRWPPESWPLPGWVLCADLGQKQLKLGWVIPNGPSVPHSHHTKSCLSSPTMTLGALSCLFQIGWAQRSWILFFLPYSAQPNA